MINTYKAIFAKAILPKTLLFGQNIGALKPAKIAVISIPNIKGKPNNYIKTKRKKQTILQSSAGLARKLMSFNALFRFNFMNFLGAAV